MMQQENYIETKVIGRTLLTENLLILKLKPKTPFSFEPGQYCTLELEGIQRPFSICSAPHEGIIELFMEMVPDHLRKPTSLTPKLFHLHEGDKINLRPKAKGLFILDCKIKTHVMVSTVTGVAPYVSMIRAYLHGYYKTCQVQKPIYVFQGASYHDEFGYLEEFKSYEKEGIIYVPTLSRPQEEHNQIWKGKTGRVNLILEELFQKYNIQPKDTLVYLCGNRGMIAYAGNRHPTPDKPLGILIQKGFQTKDEVYF